MKKTLLFLALTLSVGHISAQKGSFWQKVGAERAAGRQVIRTINDHETESLFSVDKEQLKQSLSSAADKLSGQPGVEVVLPNAKGQMEHFLVWENSNFAPGLQAQYPGIRAYAGKGITDPGASINFSVSNKGVKSMILRGDRSSEFIEPYTTDYSVYVVYDAASRNSASLPWTCGTEDVALNHDIVSQVTNRSNDQNYRTMRLALSCNGEYTVYHGGTVQDALDAMNATMTRVNGVLEKDLALHLNIIDNNATVVYTNPATDPYTTNLNQWNQQLQTALTNNIGNANYDIGHMFGSTGGGGNAGCIGCVCVNPTAGTPLGKGSGITSPADGIPEGDNFDIDYVIHEMGHQLGANHTFSIGTQNQVENNTVNVEPGSGSTIMAYAGITEANVQAHSDPYFTYRSVLQIQTNLASKTCPVIVPLANTPPVVSAGADYTIPKGTAFKLTGTATDSPNDVLSYCWEENDDANVPATYATALTASLPSATKTNGPNFRSFNPVAVPYRYFPAFQTVLNGRLSSTWEATSTVARTLNFALTARDNNPSGGQTNTDAMVVTVNGTAGPFKVTYPSTSNENWASGSSKTVTWDVAGTTANNINTSAVDILLSTDGGQNWTTLVAGTPNDGSEAITVPNTPAPFCRIMVQPVGNVYYAISKSFAINYTLNCTTYPGTISNAAVAGPDTSYFVQGSLTVPDTDNLPIADVNLLLNITHPSPSDLYFGIVKPNSNIVDVPVYQASCATGSPANINATFDDDAAPLNCATLAGGGTQASVQPLTALNGGTANGVWRFAIADVTTANSGTLNSWGLQICYLTPSLGTGSEELLDFALYPNPNHGSFSVKFTPDGMNDINIDVHDIQGRKIYNKKFPVTGAFEENLQLSSVQTGIYLVTVQNGANKTVKRIIVE